MYIYWGTPLESKSTALIVAILFSSTDEAYRIAKELMHDFNRINPSYWIE